MVETSLTADCDSTPCGYSVCASGGYCTVTSSSPGFNCTCSAAGWLGWAMALGSFQCRGVLLLLHIVGQVPAVLAAGMGRMG